MRKRYAFLVLISHFILTATVFSDYGKMGENFISSQQLTLSAFRNLRGILDWKKHLIAYHQKTYHSVQIVNFNKSLLKLKKNINQKILNYQRDMEESIHYNQVLIPMIIIKREDKPYNKLRLYCNGVILSPEKVEYLGDMTVYLNGLKSSPTGSPKTIYSYSLVLYSFTDFIANQNVIFSLKNEKDIKQGFNVGRGVLSRELFMD
ncbi:MAG: hypothetical protein OEZ36_01660 [Spirochaetota bacterium]|nr:hypothetical protein [Spirochaetota bacterium]